MGGPLAARGVAVADLDGDGNGDVIIAQNSGPAVFCIMTSVVGGPGLADCAHRDGVPNGRRAALAWRFIPRVGCRFRTMTPAMGYMAPVGVGARFGPGGGCAGAEDRDSLALGKRQELRPNAINQTLVIREP